MALEPRPGSDKGLCCWKHEAQGTLPVFLQQPDSSSGLPQLLLPCPLPSPQLFTHHRRWWLWSRKFNRRDRQQETKV